MSEKMILYYHSPEGSLMAGRGENVRLLLAEAGVEWEEGGLTDTKNMYGWTFQSKNEGLNGSLPPFAPPLLKDGDMLISQSSTIARYLARKLNMLPKGYQQEVQADALCESALDFVSEGRHSFHPSNTTSYHDQKAEAAPYIKEFGEKRIPRWIQYFERVLTANGDGNGYLIGDDLTYVDIIVFQSLRAAEYQFAEEYAKVDAPKIKAFAERMAKRPRIAAFLASDKAGKFSGDSMM